MPWGAPSSRRATTRSTMLPTATHEIPSRRLTGVRSVTCARYAADSSNAAVNTLLPSAHGTRSTFTPHREHEHPPRRILQLVDEGSRSPGVHELSAQKTTARGGLPGVPPRWPPRRQPWATTAPGPAGFYGSEGRSHADTNDRRPGGPSPVMPTRGCGFLPRRAPQRPRAPRYGRGVRRTPTTPCLSAS